MGGSLGGGTVLSLSSGSTLIEHASGERVCDHAEGAVTRQQARHGCPADWWSALIGVVLDSSEV